MTTRAFAYNDQNRRRMQARSRIVYAARYFCLSEGIDRSDALDELNDAVMEEMKLMKSKPGDRRGVKLRGAKDGGA